MLENTTWQVTLLGSNANNGTNAEEFYWNLNNVAGNLNANISGQLSLFQIRRYGKCMENHASRQNTKQDLIGVGRTVRSRRLRGEISR